MNGHQKQKEESKEMMEEALFALMEEKSYSKITVTEIVERAGVARRTFYRLYDGKDDIINSYFNKLGIVYRSRYAALKDYDLERIAEDFFVFWYQYRNILLLLHRSGQDSMIYYGISRVSVDVVKNRIKNKDLREVFGLQYFISYSTGGFINLLLQWISDGMRESPEQYAKTVSKAILFFIGKTLSVV